MFNVFIPLPFLITSIRLPQVFCFLVLFDCKDVLFSAHLWITCTDVILILFLMKHVPLFRTSLWHKKKCFVFWVFFANSMKQTVKQLSPS